MYKLEFLPIAKKDIENILIYISNNLNNKSAAKKMASLFIKSVYSILQFPYGSSVFKTTKLEQEYRTIRVKNYLMIYTLLFH